MSVTVSPFPSGGISSGTSVPSRPQSVSLGVSTRPSVQQFVCAFNAKAAEASSSSSSGKTTSLSRSSSIARSTSSQTAVFGSTTAALKKQLEQQAAARPARPNTKQPNKPIAPAAATTVTTAQQPTSTSTSPVEQNSATTAALTRSSSTTFDADSIGQQLAQLEKDRENAEGRLRRVEQLLKRIVDIEAEIMAHIARAKEILLSGKHCTVGVFCGKRKLIDGWYNCSHGHAVACMDCMQEFEETHKGRRNRCMVCRQTPKPGETALFQSISDVLKVNNTRLRLVRNQVTFLTQQAQQAKVDLDANNRVTSQLHRKLSYKPSPARGGILAVPVTGSSSTRPHLAAAAK